MPSHLIIDSNYLLHRVLHNPATAELCTSSGQQTGGVFGFLRALRKTLIMFSSEHTLGDDAGTLLIDDFFRPVTHVTAVWDAGLSARRLQLHPGYKGSRRRPLQERTPEDLAYRDLFRSQKVYLTFILPKLGVNIVTLPSGEADDIIYWLSRRLHHVGGPLDGVNTVVMSDDKDYFQMLSNWVSLYRPLAEEFYPHQDSFSVEKGFPLRFFLLYRALVGDPSDDIPGVPRVGEKTAKQMISDAIKSNPSMGLTEATLSLQDLCVGSTRKTHRSVLDHWDRVELNLELLDLSKEELSDDHVKILDGMLQLNPQLNHQVVADFCQRMEFKSIVKSSMEFNDFLRPFFELGRPLLDERGLGVGS